MKRRPYSARAAQLKDEADAMFAFYNDGPGELLVDDPAPTEAEQKPGEGAKPLKVTEEERARAANKPEGGSK